MAKRGPKKPNYDEADRPFRIAALQLMLDEHLTANRAAWRIGPKNLVGGTTESKQRRLQRWLTEHGGSTTEIEYALVIEQTIEKTGTYIKH